MLRLIDFAALGFHHIITSILLTQEDDELSVNPKRRITIDLYTKEREGKTPMPTAKAWTQCRVPVPSPPPCHGGRRGRWGQERVVGAGEANGGREPPATCLSPPAPNSKDTTGPHPWSTLPLWPKAFQTNEIKPNKSLRSSSEFQISLYPNPKKI